MQSYRAYIIGTDGHFIKAVEISCENDTIALAQARQFVDGHDVELWQGDRRVACLKSTPEK